jgi:virginiamycin B lyase
MEACVESLTVVGAWVRRTLGIGLVMAAAAAGAVMVFGASPASAGVPSPTLYWSYIDGPNNVSSAVGAADLAGASANFTFLPGVGNFDGMAVDGQHLYAPEDGAIQEFNLDGSDEQTFSNDDSDAVALAVNDDYIYWADYDDRDGSDSGYGTIGRMKLDGTDVEPDFITGAFAPDAVAVDGNDVYWVNTGVNDDYGDQNGDDTVPHGPMSIGRANLNGTDVDQSFITDVYSPSGVAVTGSHIYWSDASAAEEPMPGPAAASIAESNLDGTGITTFASFAGHFPGALAADGQDLYWTDNTGDNTSGAVEFQTLSGTGTPATAISDSGVALSVAVSQPHIVLGSISDFGTVPATTLSGPETLTVTNSGQQPLNLTDLTYTGANPSDFSVTSNSCENAIAPQASCQLTVQFAPQAEGARSASLNIYSDDWANSPMAVALTGTGGSAPTTPGVGGGSTGGGTGSTGSGGGSTGSSGSGTPQPPKLQAITLAGGDTIKVSLSCASTAAECAPGIIAETVTEKLRGGVITGITAERRAERKVVRTVTRQVIIAKGTITPGPGQTRILTLTLDKTGRELLARYHKLSAALTVKVSGKVIKRTTAHLRELTTTKQLR